MTISYQYVVKSVSAYAEYNGQTNCVYYIEWDLTGTDGTNSAKVPRVTYVPYDPNVQYIPSNQLTLSNLLAWIEEYSDANTILELKDQISASIQTLIDEASIVQISVPSA